MSAHSCRDVRALLSAYLDGDLDAGLTGEVRAHLERCPDCRSDLELLRISVGALRRLPELPPPAAILAGVRARLRPEPWYRRLLGGSFRHFDFPLSAAATLLVVFGASLYLALNPDVRKTVSQGPSPQFAMPPALEKAAPPPPIAPIAPASPAGRADRPSSPPAPPPQIITRAERRAKGTRDSAPLPQAASVEREIAAAKSSASADAEDFDLAAPAVPVVPAAPPEPGVAAGLATGGSELGQVQSGKPAAFLNDAREPQSSRQAPLAFAPSPGVGNKTEAVLQPAPSDDKYPAAQTVRAQAARSRLSAARDELDVNTEGTFRQPVEKKEISNLTARMEESSAGLRRANLAGEKAKASAALRIVCQLPPDGESMDDITRLLRREGAADIAVTELKPHEVRAIFAPHRDRRGFPPEPARGWTVTVTVSKQDFMHLLDVLTRRTSLRILEQPAAPLAPEDQTEPRDLSITILR